MKNVLVRLQEYSAQATTTEKEVIAFLLKEPEQAAGCSIHELAERTFSSTSTVIRLCQKTGFRGYKGVFSSPCSMSWQSARIRWRSRWRRSAGRTAWKRSSIR